MENHIAKLKQEKILHYFLLFVEGYNTQGHHFLNLLYTTKGLDLQALIDEIEVSYSLTSVQINGWYEVNRTQAQIWMNKKSR